MKTVHIAASICLGLIAISCAKSASSETNAAEKRFFDAWVSTHFPEVVGKSVWPGIYIVKDKAGTGELIGDSSNSPYVRLQYTARTLDSAITLTSEEKYARQMGTYSRENYYGPEIFARSDNSLYVCLDAALTDMYVNGERSILIPGWLFTTLRYDTEKEYLENVTGNINCIYDIHPVERISDIVTWETDSLKRYMKRAFGYTDEQCEKDTLKNGYYKVQVTKPTTDEPFPADTTIYVNYTGRRLDGQVFDTTIADTAKVYGIYSSSKTYEPQNVLIKSDYTSTTMASSSLIDGFAYLLNNMKPFESAIGIFYSGYGYSSSGSGSTIPSYCPLQFEISVVEKPAE